MEAVYKDIADLSIGLEALLEPKEILPGMSLNSTLYRSYFHISTADYEVLTKEMLESSYLMPALRCLATQMGTGKRWKVGDGYPIDLKSGQTWRTIYNLRGLPVLYSVTYQDARVLTPDPNQPKGRYLFELVVFATEVGTLTADQQHALYDAFDRAGCCIHDLPPNGLQAIIDTWEEIR